MMLHARRAGDRLDDGGDLRVAEVEEELLLARGARRGACAQDGQREAEARAARAGSQAAHRASRDMGARADAGAAARSEPQANADQSGEARAAPSRARKRRTRAQ